MSNPPLIGCWNTRHHLTGTSGDTLPSVDHVVDCLDIVLTQCHVWGSPPAGRPQVFVGAAVVTYCHVWTAGGSR